MCDPLAMCVNSLAFLCSTMRMLADAQLTTWIFGGWAEELWQISAPRTHNDIDLLYPAHDFTELDRWSMATEGVVDIVGKRFSHKRAVVYQQIMIEFLLIERTRDGFRTNFFEGLHILNWPQDTLQFTIRVDERTLNLASPAALRYYRQHHTEVQRAYQTYTRRQALGMGIAPNDAPTAR